MFDFKQREKTMTKWVLLDSWDFNKLKKRIQLMNVFDCVHSRYNYTFYISINSGITIIIKSIE